MASAAAKIEPDEGVEIPGEGEDPNVNDVTERDYEAEARERGWVPKEEFEKKPNADPSRWVDAKSFVERTDTVMPLLKADRDRLKRELSDLKRDLRKATAHFEGAEKRAYDRAKAEIEGRIEDATEVGDVAAVKAGLKELDGLKPDTSSKHSREDAEEAFDGFREANPWYDKANLASASELEVNARLYADRMTEKHIARTADMAPDDFFAMIADLTHEKYPQLKAVPARKKPASDVEGSGQGKPRGSSRSWENLPDSAKRTYQRFIDKGIGVKSTGDKDKDVAAARAYYAKTHDWEGYKE